MGRSHPTQFSHSLPSLLFPDLLYEHCPAQPETIPDIPQRLLTWNGSSELPGLPRVYEYQPELSLELPTLTESPFHRTDSDLQVLWWAGAIMVPACLLPDLFVSLWPNLRGNTDLAALCTQCPIGCPGWHMQMQWNQ